MKQAVMTEPGKIRFDEIEKPRPEADEVLVKIKVIGVCGSDIHVYHGLHPYTSYPVVQGHEVSGEVTETGKDVKAFRPGQKVTVLPQVVCGKCYPCTHGMYHICDSLKVMGFQTGGTAQEYIALKEQYLLAAPENLSFEQISMIEPTAVAVHALGRAGDVRGKKVAVIGAGTIGNLVAQCAKGLGAEKVLITDVSDFRLEKAKECGADIAVNTSQTGLDAVIAEHFGPDKADLILECVGSEITIGQAITSARKGSTIIVVGVFGKKANVEFGLVQDRELSLVGTLMYQKRDFEKAIDLINAGKIWLEKLITDRFPFERYLDAYEFIEGQKEKAMKVLIMMPE